MCKKEVGQIVKALATLVTLTTIGAVLSDRVFMPWIFGDE